MKIIKLTRDMHPWRKGDDAVVPDALAEQLVSKNEAEGVRPFPPLDVVFDPRVNDAVVAPPDKTVAHTKSFLTRAERRAQRFGGRRNA